MKDLIVKSITETIQSPKTALTIAGGTAVNGIATWFQWIETNIGIISSMIGAVSVTILTIIQIQKSIREDKEHKAKMQLLMRKLGEE